MPFVRMQTLCPGIKYMDRPKAEKVLICEKGQAHVKTRTHSFLTETSPEHLVRIVFTIIFPLVFSFLFARVFARWWLGRGLLRLMFVVCLRVCHIGCLSQEENTVLPTGNRYIQLQTANKSSYICLHLVAILHLHKNDTFEFKVRL